MEAHPKHTTYHSKVYDYAYELLQLYPDMSLKDMQRKISYYKDVPMIPLGTLAHWHAHPDVLPGLAEEARRRKAKNQTRGR